MASVRSYFSGRDDLQEVVLENLNEARRSIHVAVAWLTDGTLFNKLLERQSEGVKVELIITKHEFNLTSPLDHEAIGENGGVFLELGSDTQLMHHKFCIVDRTTVLQGSFNWTKRASQSNQETLTVIKEDPTTVNEFLAEFDRMKEAAGVADVKEALDLAETFKYFQLLRAFIGLGRVTDVNAHAHELKGTPDLEAIAELLFEGNYPEAEQAMAEFERRHRGLVDVTAAERTHLKGRIRLLNGLVAQLVGEREELNALIGAYNHRFYVELNPWIAKILALKKRIYEKLAKLGVVQNTYEEIEEEFRRVNEEYEAERKVEVAELDPEEEQDIKDMYREAVTLCHPDSSKCIFEDKRKAAEVFSRLSQAKKENDIRTVREILEQLRGGSWSGLEDVNELEVLRAKLASLERSYGELLRELEEIRITEPYLTIKDLEDWDDYFEKERSILEAQYDELLVKYAEAPTNEEEP